MLSIADLGFRIVDWGFKSAIRNPNSEIKLAHRSLFEIRDAHHFFQTRLFLLRQPEALLQQRSPAVASVAVADIVCARTTRNQRPDLTIDGHHFINARASQKPCVVALRATFATDKTLPPVARI